MAPFYTRAVEQALARDEAGYMAQLARYQDRLFAAGLTRVYDAAVSPLMEATLRRAVELDVLRIPVLMMLASGDGMFMPPRDRLEGTRTGEGDDLLRTGPLKLFMDGGERAAMALPLGFMARSTLAAIGQMLRRRSRAALRASGGMTGQLDKSDWRYHSGILFYTEAEARELVDGAVARGLSLALHAEGNEGIERALAVLPRSPEQRAPGVGPHRIEHFFFPGSDAIGLTAEAGHRHGRAAGDRRVGGRSGDCDGNGWPLALHPDSLDAGRGTHGGREQRRTGRGLRPSARDSHGGAAPGRFRSAGRGWRAGDDR